MKKDEYLDVAGAYYDDAELHIPALQPGQQPSYAGYAAAGSQQKGSAYAEAQAQATQTALYNEASASLSDDPTYSMAAQTAPYDEASPNMGIVTAQGMAF